MKPAGIFARREGAGKLLAMMGLAALVLFVIGILRPLRSAFALSGLAAGDFYQVYFISAAVVVVAPLYNALSDRISWRRLIPLTAAFFALSMVAFRLLYRPGEAWFGLIFYGWYDVLAASLVTHFYIATQVFYNARDAKRAYPIVIAAGSTGATLGALLTTVFTSGGGPSENLLLVAGGALLLLAGGLALVWSREPPEPPSEYAHQEDPELERSDLSRMAAHPQIRLIAATVLLTIIVKQFIDYQYNTLTREVFTDLGAIAGFLAFVDVLTQWLPIVVLLALRPILRRWGAAVAVIIFPLAVILATGALAAAVWLSTAALAVAVGARTTEKTFRYSAERTGREILYVPVPEDIKLKAKSYIDVAVEKGLGKVLSGVLIAIPSLALAGLPIMGRLIILGVVGLGFAGILLLAFLKVRKSYVTSLAESFEGRFASLRGTSVSLADAGALALARDALRDERPLKVAFAFDLLRGATPEDIEALSPELYQLLEHENPDLRARALRALSRAPGLSNEEALRACLEDPDSRVRRAAARALALQAVRAREVLIPLLDSESPNARSAALDCLFRHFGTARAERIATPRFEHLLAEHAQGRLAGTGANELAIAAGLVPGHPAVEGVLLELISHSRDEVAAAAARSAARMPQPVLVRAAIEALADPRTRGAARDGLAGRGEEIVTPLLEALSDPSADPWVRRGVASVLGEIAAPATVDALVTSYLLPETEQALDDQALVSLHHLRSRHDDLVFPLARVLRAVRREVQASLRYAGAAGALERVPESMARGLLLRALDEARRDRRASVFRWLGLVYPQQSMRRSYLALESGRPRRRANALEWIESTVGHRTFAELRPVLAEETPGGRVRDVREVLRELWDDEDAWIARCALWTSHENFREETKLALEGYVPAEPALALLARGLARGAHARVRHSERERDEDEMELIEKVFRLQSVDLLSGVKSRQLALLASIAHEVEARPDAVFIRRGEPTDALYLVIRGEVSLEGAGEGSISIADGAAFGTWALIDEHPSLVEARAVKATRVLRITREDFRDLLIDHPELGLDLLRGLASRVRGLAMA